MVALLRKGKEKIRFCSAFSALGASSFSKLKFFLFACFIPTLHWRGIETAASFSFDVVVNGTRTTVSLRNYADLMTFKEIFIDHEYGSVKNLKNPSVIFDLGAHIGFTSVYFASLFPDASIFAVEANPANLALLKKNTMSWDRITICNVAVSGEEGEVTFYTHPTRTPSGSLVRREGSEPITVHAKTLKMLQDELVPDKGVDLLKFDIEGAEHEVFKNSVGSLQRIQYLIGEVHLDLIPTAKEEFIALFDGFRTVEHYISKDRFVLEAEKI